jgi:DNA-binding NarL/FixJ family response regulator
MRVVIADDSPIAREGIARLLAAEGVDVLGECGDADALYEQVAALQPDVAIVDIRMPPTHTDEGLVASQTLRERHPEVGVLVLSQHLEAGYALRLVDTHPGRVGYLLKERVSDIGVVVDALRRIDAGETVIEPAIVTELLGYTYYVAYNCMKQNKDGVQKVAEKLIERREMHGDEVVELLDSANLKPAKIDYLEESTWPRL